MLYKVTPMMAPPQLAKPKTTREPGQPRKRRKTAIFDGEGHEVLITLMCLKCKGMKPLAQFGLRKMADGAIRNQPWCRGCRSQAGTKPKKTDVEVDGTTAEQVAPDAMSLAADPAVAAPDAMSLAADPAVAAPEAMSLAADPVVAAPLEVSAQDAEETQPMVSASSDLVEQTESVEQEQSSQALPHAADEAPTLGQ